MDISTRLRQFGESKFSTITEFASAVEMSPQTLQNYLNGRSLPGNKLQQRLRSLGCNIEWLMTGKNVVEYKQLEENAELIRLREEIETIKRAIPAEILNVLLKMGKTHEVKYSKIKKIEK